MDVNGITLSPAQAQLARERCAGLPVEIREQDYRNLSDQFDRIVSIGMFEHVGPENYRRNLDAAWPALGERYSDRFRRLWRYYLLMCAGTFRARRNQLWQIVLSLHGVRKGYRRVA